MAQQTTGTVVDGEAPPANAPAGDPLRTSFYGPSADSRPPAGPGGGPSSGTGRGAALAPPDSGSFDSNGPLPARSGVGPALPATGPADVPRVDGFQITTPLGQGGMGTVWRAWQLSTRREVALKFLSLAHFGSDRARRRFDREIELAGRLQHPHIARVYDSGVLQGAYYYAMELVDGVPLDDYAAGRKLDPRAALALVRLVCLAVQHAHQRGIIHRDLKPSNILVDADGQPHVLDFGLAKAFDADGDATSGDAIAGNITSGGDGSRAPAISLDGELAGTPAFMSPEQAAGRVDHLDTRSDVYSLGVILYRLLTGKSPHDLSGGHLDVLRRVSEQDPVRPRKAAPDLDPELEALLLKALAKDPDARYPSAGALADDVANYLAGEPLTARPATTAYFLRKRLYKHRWPIAAASAVLGLIVGAAVYSSISVAHARDQALVFAQRAGLEKRAADDARAKEADLRKTSDAQAIDLGLGLLPWGGTQGAVGRWDEARRVYWDVYRVLDRRGVPPLAARLALADADARSPEPFHVLGGGPAGPAGGVLAVAFPTAAEAAGRGAAAVGADQSFRRWDLFSGLQTAEAAGKAAPTTSPADAPANLNRPPPPTERAVFSPDGRVVLVVRQDPWRLRKPRTITAELRDAATGLPAGTIPVPEGILIDAAVAEGGRMVALVVVPPGDVAPGQPPARIHVWDMTTDRTRTLRGGVAGACKVVFAPGGTTLVTAEGDGRLKAWEAGPRAGTDGDEPRTLDGQTGNVLAMAASADGRLVLTADTNGELALWDVPAGRRLRAIGRSRAPVAAAALSADGRLALTGDTAGATRVWDTARDAARGPSPDRSEVGDGSLVVLVQPAAVWAVAYRPARPGSPPLVLTGGADGATRVGAVGDGRVGDGPRRPDPAAVPEPDAPEVRAVDLSADGRLLLTGDGVGAVRLTDLATGRRLATFQVTEPIARVALTPDARTALAGDWGGTVTAWDVETGRRRWQVSAGGRVNDVAFSPDRRQALFGGQDLLKMFDLPRDEADAAAGARQAWAFDLKGDTARAVAFSPKGDAVACSDLNGHTVWIDLNPWRVRWNVQTAPARSLAFAPDAGRLLVGDVAGGVSVVDADTGIAARPIRAHDAAVTAVTFCPDGRTALTGASDGTLRLYDLSTGRLAHELPRRPGDVRCVLAAPDGRSVLAAAGPGGDYSPFDPPDPAAGVRRWDLSRPDEARDLSARLDAARAALARNPDDPAAWATLGRWYAANGLWDWAAQALEKARAGGTAAADVPPLLLARCYMAMGRTEDARRAVVGVQVGDARATTGPPDVATWLLVRSLGKPVDGDGRPAH